MNPNNLDQDRFVLPGETLPPPVTVSGLLNDLQVHRESREIQQAAVSQWLQNNEPHPSLKPRLKRAGFIA